MRSYSVAPFDQHLQLDGVDLVDDKLTLSDLHVTPGCILELRVRKNSFIYIQKFFVYFPAHNCLTNLLKIILDDISSLVTDTIMNQAFSLISNGNNYVTS